MDCAPIDRYPSPIPLRKKRGPTQPIISDQFVCKNAKTYLGRYEFNGNLSFVPGSKMVSFEQKGLTTTNAVAVVFSLACDFSFTTPRAIV